MSHQQARGDGDDIGCSIFRGEAVAGAGFGDVAKDISMDNSSKDEVNMADQDEH